MPHLIDALIFNDHAYPPQRLPPTARQRQPRPLSDHFHMQRHPSCTAHLAVTGHLRVYMLRMHEVLFTISKDWLEEGIQLISALATLSNQCHRQVIYKLYPTRTVYCGEEGFGRCADHYQHMH